jgi:hypothetical protein
MTGFILTNSKVNHTLELESAVARFAHQTVYKLRWRSHGRLCQRIALEGLARLMRSQELIGSPHYKSRSTFCNRRRRRPESQQGHRLDNLVRILLEDHGTYASVLSILSIDEVVDDPETGGT